MESWFAVATASRQTTGADWLVYAVVMVTLTAALILGFISGAWLLDPLSNTGHSQEYRQRVSEQRQARVCLVTALLCYYIPALIIVRDYAGWSAIVPYLRAHIFDGFGCAALFGLAFSRLRLPLVDTAATAQPAGATSQLASALANRRVAVSTAQLSFGAALIAACSAWVAGGSWLAVLYAGLWTFTPLQLFWSLAVGMFVYGGFGQSTPGT
jgi:hypothetical protein